MAPIQKHKQLKNTCLFSKDGNLFLSVYWSVDHQLLNVWDVKTGKQICLFDGSKLSGGSFTHVSWMDIDNVDGKRRKAQEDEKIDVVAVGTQLGQIHLISPATEAIVKTFTGGHGKTVTGFSVSNCGKVAFSSSADGMVIEWNVDTCDQSNSWRAESSSLDAVCCMKEGQVATAADSVKVWDTVSKQQTKAYIGFASSISEMLYTNDGILFYASLSDRFINASLDTGTTATLANQSKISQISAGKKYFGALGADGQISIWKRSAIAKSQKKRSMKPEGLISLFNAESETEEILQILGFTFAGEKSKICFAWGLAQKPIFETVSVVDDETNKVGCTVKRKKSESALAKVNSSDNSFEDAQIYRRPIESNAVVVGAIDAPIVRSTNSSAIKTDSVTMEEKLKSLQLLDATFNNDQNATKKTIPKPDSLLQMLTQALHSGDKQLLEECLAVGHQLVIDKTISALPAGYVLRMLVQLVDRFQINANRGPALTRWLKSLLTFHMSYLISLPDISSQLAPLYQAVDHRISVFPSLLKLNGRLTIINNQIKQKRENARNMQEMYENLQQPIMYFDENDEMDAESNNEYENGESEQDI